MTSLTMLKLKKKEQDWPARISELVENIAILERGLSKKKYNFRWSKK